MDAADDDEAQRDRSTTIAERIERKRRKISCSDKAYMDCSFILGSVAIVERLWATAKSFLPDNRMKTTLVILNHFCLCV